MYHILGSDFFDFEFLRVLGTAPTQGADVAECLEAASKIKLNDAESWYRAWTEAAEKAEVLGEEGISSGDTETARWAFLRASNYRRASEYMLRGNPSEPRLLDSITKAVENFKKAIPFLGSPVVPLEIPYEGHTLPAYLFLPKAGTECSSKAPVIISTGGFDTIQEEIYHFVASGARLRGYATLIFEGPGQGIVLRRDKLYLRGDWEVVISAVLDQLFKSAENNPGWNLDLERIAIVGNSMGAYFSLRATAADSRIKACVASDGFFNLGAAGKDRVPAFVNYINPTVFDAVVGFALKFNFRLHWELGHATLALGAKSLADMLDTAQGFTLEPPGEKPVCGEITCPVLVTNAQDTIYPIEPHRIYKGLTQLKEGETKTLWDPVGIGHGSIQAKVGTLSLLHAKIFQWLDEVFEMRRDTRSQTNGLS